MQYKYSDTLLVLLVTVYDVHRGGSKIFIYGGSYFAKNAP